MPSSFLPKAGTLTSDALRPDVAQNVMLIVVIAWRRSSPNLGLASTGWACPVSDLAVVRWVRPGTVIALR